MEMELQRNFVENAERWFKRQNDTLVQKTPNAFRAQVRLLHARLLLVQGRRSKDAENSSNPMPN